MFRRSGHFSVINYIDRMSGYIYIYLTTATVVSAIYRNKLSAMAIFLSKFQNIILEETSQVASRIQPFAWPLVNFRHFV